jgi:hypothetical protein
MLLMEVSCLSHWFLWVDKVSFLSGGFYEPFVLYLQILQFCHHTQCGFTLFILPVSQGALLIKNCYLSSIQEHPQLLCLQNHSSAISFMFFFWNPCLDVPPKCVMLQCGSNSSCGKLLWELWS